VVGIFKAELFMKKYPVYVFLLLSGFFYLTGRPIDDRHATRGVQAVIGPGTLGRPDVAGGSGQAVKAERNGRGAAGRQSEKRIAMLSLSPVPERRTAMGGGRPPVTVMAESELKTSSLHETATSRNSSPVANIRNKAMQYGSTTRKVLDWRIFGNDRRAGLGANYSYSPAQHMHRQTEAERRQLEAAAYQEGGTGEAHDRGERAYRYGRSFRKSPASRIRRVRSRRTRIRRWARRRKAVGRSRYARKMKRLALLRQRRRALRRRKRSLARSAYRVARHRRRHNSGKKWYASLFKPQHRRGYFGFVTRGGITSLINN